ncbi:hypothetical protein QVD17_19951 [Tagetes erecta]|uniref:Uncharacterized protein n=1 Tax=Tagetes erecta TaxID=13708 RepID=A0AAD8KKR4_TARER|nr:hypothetical protein QVD17_19951 [Tagetes erecta]
MPHLRSRGPIPRAVGTAWSKVKGAFDDAISLHLFPFSLMGQAATWLDSQLAGTLTTWSTPSSARYVHQVSMDTSAAAALENLTREMKELKSKVDKYERSPGQFLSSTKTYPSAQLKAIPTGSSRVLEHVLKTRVSRKVVEERENEEVKLEGLGSVQAKSSSPITKAINDLEL